MARSWTIGRATFVAAVAALALAGYASMPSVAKAPPAAAARVQGVHVILQDAVDKNIAPGFVLMLANARGQTHIDVRGLADRERAVPLSAEALFRLYSMTKPVTAAAALVMVEEGKIALDDPVSKFVPEFAAARVYAGGDTLESLKTEPLVRPLTVRDLLRQTAGIVYFGLNTPVERLFAMRGVERAPGEPVPGYSGERDTTIAAWARRVAGTPLAAQPGTQFTYGGALDLLGRVLEVADGRPLREVLAARVLAPLGMRSTTFVVAPPSQAKLTAAYALKSPNGAQAPILSNGEIARLAKAELFLVDDPAKSPFAQDGRIEFGGAGLVGTAGDFLRFARMLAGQGEVDGVRLLSRESVAAMGTNQLGPEASARIADIGIGYGYGLGVVEVPGKIAGAPPKGMMFWGGAAGTFFWADPHSGEAGVLMTQVFGDDIRAYHAAVVKCLFEQHSPTN